MTDPAPDRSASPHDAAARRRQALSAAARRDADDRRGFALRVRSDERKRYIFQLWTTSAFAAVWLLVFALSGSWLFLALAVGFALLAALAGTALSLVRRRSSTSEL